MQILQNVQDVTREVYPCQYITCQLACKIYNACYKTIGKYCIYNCKKLVLQQQHAVLRIYMVAFPLLEWGQWALIGGDDGQHQTCRNQQVYRKPNAEVQ